MLNIHYYTDYFIKIGSTRWGRSIYSVLVGAIGAVILVLFLTGGQYTATIDNLLPLIIGFNTALTGYMIIEKTRKAFTRKRTVSMAAGVAVVLVATVLLNVIFGQWAGVTLIGFDNLLLLLLVGLTTSGLGGSLAVKYFSLN